MRLLFVVLFFLVLPNTLFSQEESIDIYVPNSFTSDNDGLNDAWRTYSDVKWDEFRVEVYNPWGTLIWYSNDQYEWWMGESDMSSPLYYSPNGTYHYVLVASKDNKRITKKGTIYKLR